MGQRIAAFLEAGDVVALFGPLGGGKTCLTKGIALGLGVGSADEVTSPTFVYLRTYRGRIPIYHLDAYRIRSESEFLELGGWELLGEDGVSVIEWADRLGASLPPDRLEVRIDVLDASSRDLRMAAFGRCEDRLKDLS